MKINLITDLHLPCFLCLLWSLMWLQTLFLLCILVLRE